MLKIMFVTTLAAGLLIAMGCASQPSTDSHVADGTYVVTQVDGETFTPAKPVIVTIAEERISGSGPVNRWTGGVEDRQIGAIAATKMAGPPEQMKLETKLFKALENGHLHGTEAGGINILRDQKITVTMVPTEN